jgi:hypothetical protein
MTVCKSYYMVRNIINNFVCIRQCMILSTCSVTRVFSYLSLPQSRHLTDNRSFIIRPNTFPFYQQDTHALCGRYTIDCRVMQLCMNVYELLPADCWHREYNK